MSDRDKLQRGLVVRSEGGFYTVVTGDERLLCTLFKRLRRGERTATNPLVVGDEVMARATGGGQGAIEEILPRRNELVRTAPGRDALKHVLVANLDLLLIVAAMREPPLNLARLDRFLLIAAQAEIPATIVVNKIDLADRDEVTCQFEPYRRAGFRVVETSVIAGEGISALRAALASGINAVIGSSGVGKSSLLNAMQPGLRLRAGDVSARTGKGRHTTTVAELLPLDGGGYVADTPGLRGIEPYDLDPEMLEQYFPEMELYLGGCRFSPCTHLHEPGCAVRGAVEAGEIAPSRYESYVKLYEEARETARKRARGR